MKNIAAIPPRALEILTFWFTEAGPEPGTEPAIGYGQLRKAWFQKNPKFDDQIRQHFFEDYQQAATGQLQAWKTQPQSCLALILLLDQFPRNLFRGDARSFATDAQALDAAQWAVSQSFDQSLLLVERLFMYLPFEHSEDLAHQHQAVALITPLRAADATFDSTVDYAYRHRAVIERFGRFPHRNDSLGRLSTPEEVEFLQQPGSRF